MIVSATAPVTGNPSLWGLPYRTLVWLDYRLAVVFCVALPLVLLIWALVRQEGAIVRLLTLYWKVSSLLAVTVLFLSDRRPIGYVLGVLAQLLIIASVWFWVDLNEELDDLPPWRPLPLTVRIWRWGLSLFAGLGAIFSATALACLQRDGTPSCQVWIEAPSELMLQVDRMSSFIFGGNWTPEISVFFGYVGLLAYVAGLLQWLFVRLPRMGRVAGEF